MLFVECLLLLCIILYENLDSTFVEHLPISEYRQALAEYWRITAIEDDNCELLKI
jgi:hypothetical protein